ncbi:metallophosphoesterase [Pseudomonas sp. NPDC089530]|uniref:metallophosphoesterase n=1 Tax=Pseudomonas sp. NPDC089530 TaxID=3390651 RepID=UPI003D063E3E
MNRILDVKRNLRRIGATLALLSLLALAAGYWLLTPPEPYVPLTGLDPSNLSLIALGDQGSGRLQQWRVAQSMEQVADRDGRLDLVVLLGDNFYGKSLTGTADRNWEMKFERVYWGRWLSHVPFYAVLGNHDYPVSQAVELDYSRQHAGSGRWQMPAHDYVKDFGWVDGRPLLRMVFLDTAAPRDGLAQQAALIEQAFQQPGPEPVWRVVAAHHPLRNEGLHGDDEVLLGALLPALQRSKVDLFLAGHDHNQQLILRPGEPAWVISGAGGQKLYTLGAPREDTRFSASRAGFAKLDFSAARLRLSYYDESSHLEQRYQWARSCQWLANGCLLPEAQAAVARP